jgi:hypothetical protein
MGESVFRTTGRLSKAIHDNQDPLLNIQRTINICPPSSPLEAARTPTPTWSSASQSLPVHRPTRKRNHGELAPGIIGNVAAGPAAGSSLFDILPADGGRRLPKRLFAPTSGEIDPRLLRHGQDLVREAGLTSADLGPDVFDADQPGLATRNAASASGQVQIGRPPKFPPDFGLVKNARELQQALSHLDEKVLIAGRPWSRDKVNNLLEGQKLGLSSEFRRESIARAMDKLCFQRIQPIVDAVKPSSVSHLVFLLRNYEDRRPMIHSLAGLQRLLLTLPTPVRAPLDMLEALPYTSVSNPWRHLPLFDDSTPVAMNAPASLETHDDRHGQRVIAAVSPAAPRSTTPARSPG